MKKAILMLAAALCLEASMGAQTITRNKDFASFDDIQVSNAFQVKLVESNSYLAEWTVDGNLEEYVDIYLRGKTLYIGLNEKSMPKELAKSLKAKGASPVLRVTVSAPSISTLNVSENAVFDAPGFTIKTQQFSLFAGDNAKIASLTVSARKLNVNLSKKAAATVSAETPDISLQTENSSLLNLTHTSDKMDMALSGSSSINANGNCKELHISAKGSSKATVAGRGETLEIDGQGASSIDAINFTVLEATANMNNGSFWVNATADLNLDLKGGSEVVFASKPDVNIINVVKSSVIRYENAKKK